MRSCLAMVPRMANGVWIPAPKVIYAPRLLYPRCTVVSVEDAVRGELEVIAWRDGLNSK